MDLSQQILAQRFAQDTEVISPESRVNEVSQRRIDRARDELSESHTASLSRIIESQIIPRLMLAHRAAQGASPLPAVDVQAPGIDTIAEFADIVVSNNVSVAAAFVFAWEVAAAVAVPIAVHNQRCNIGILTVVDRSAKESWSNQGGQRLDGFRSG